MKQFNVLGIDVDVLVTSQSSNGSFTMSVYHVEAGDGPPPHMHANEDEFFLVLSGSFEVWEASQRKRLEQGCFYPALRNTFHTFRNVGTTRGTLVTVARPGQLDLFLEEISTLTLPKDLGTLVEISQRYGITYPDPENILEQSKISLASEDQNMKTAKRFSILGDDVTIVYSSEQDPGKSMILTQSSPPGGGVPLHFQLDEDEVFSVLDGEYDFFDGEEWTKLRKGEVKYALRGGKHAFLNTSPASSTMHALALPGERLEQYLGAISGLQVPQDLDKLLGLSAHYGITLVGPDPDAPEGLLQ